MSDEVNRFLDQFDDSAASCACDSDLIRLLSAVLRELGFDYFALLHHASLTQEAAWLIRLDNYPSSWAAELTEEGFAAADPVHLASGRSNIGFRWDHIERLVRLTSWHREIFERSRRHGIGAGFTVPANVPGEPGGSCSFAVRRGRALPTRYLYEAELIGARAFGVARRLRDCTASLARPHLSRREIQCLRLMARGKTDWEIGRVLGISEQTARQYAKRARSAYGVASRAQLVVHGLRDAWISFDEAIPPRRGMG